MDSKFEELAEKAKKIVGEGLGEGKERLDALRDSEELDQLKRLAGDLGEEAAVFVRKYPLQSVLGAAVAGFLLGATLGRRK